MDEYDFSRYLSPFTWRYGSAQMRHIFSEQHKYEVWRTIWVALARAQHKAGLVNDEELADLVDHATIMSIERIIEIEKETKHDVVSAIKEFAQHAKKGGGKIHLGATSMDIVDNADMIRFMEAMGLIEKQLISLLNHFVKQIEAYASLPCMGFTHLQPAEPTTVGYRLAFYAQDLLKDLTYLRFVRSQMKGKGMKGAVGTMASYTQLLNGTNKNTEVFEQEVMKQLDIKVDLITTQVYTRKTDYCILSVLSSIASSLAKFAGDLRILQSPPYGEWSEPFGKKQVGSSAMPFKKNPIAAENICSLARFVTHLPTIALENATHSYLERTLDDSANKRIIMPEAFLAVDTMLSSAERIVHGLVINTKRIEHNVALYAPFAASETILMAAVKKGADRQKLHEVLREIAMEAWAAVQEGNENPMTELLKKNTQLKKYLSTEELMNVMDIRTHIGDAPARAKQLVKEIKQFCVRWPS